MQLHNKLTLYCTAAFVCSLIYGIWNINDTISNYCLIISIASAIAAVSVRITFWESADVPGWNLVLLRVFLLITVIFSILLFVIQWVSLLLLVFFIWATAVYILTGTTESGSGKKLVLYLTHVLFLCSLAYSFYNANMWRPFFTIIKPGKSSEKFSIKVEDVLFVEKLSYLTGEVNIGDMVLYKPGRFSIHHRFTHKATANCELTGEQENTLLVKPQKDIGIVVNTPGHSLHPLTFSDKEEGEIDVTRELYQHLSRENKNTGRTKEYAVLPLTLPNEVKSTCSVCYREVAWSEGSYWIEADPNEINIPGEQILGKLRFILFPAAHRRIIRMKL